MATRKIPVPAKKRARKQVGGAPPAPSQSEPVFAAPLTTTAATPPRTASDPVFAEPQLMPDPSQFRTTHASDTSAYADLDKLKKIHEFNPLPFRSVPGVAEPALNLADRARPRGAAQEGQRRSPARNGLHLGRRVAATSA